MAEKNTEKISSLDRLKNRYKAKNPDLDFDTEGAVDINGMAADELDQFDADNAARKDFDDKMNTLWGSDSRASKIFIGWANGEDPIVNLLEMYGDDFTEALQSEEGKAKFKEALEKWRKGKEADKAHKAAYDANIAQTAKNMIDFADSHGISDEEVSELVKTGHKYCAEMADGLYSPELLDMLYKAGNYEGAVNDAREEGRVAGKNENIERELRQSQSPTGLPPTAGSQNAVGGESAPMKPRTGKLDMFGGIPVSKKK